VKKLLQNEGFALVELVITIVIIMIGLGSLYGVLHRGLNQMKTVGSKDYALAAASSELEFARAMAKDGMLDTYSGPFKSEVDLSALNDSAGILAIEDMEGSSGRLKTVTATITWREAGRSRKVSLSTLAGPS
jgi:type II secretory pathway pseudopilin PulG